MDPIEDYVEKLFLIPPRQTYEEEIVLRFVLINGAKFNFYCSFSPNDMGSRLMSQDRTPLNETKKELRVEACKHLKAGYTADRFTTKKDIEERRKLIARF